MKVEYKKSIEYQIVKRLKRTPKRVILRKDLTNLGSYRQVSRTLKKLIEKKTLVKIGFGIYAKAYESPYLDEPLLVDGFDVVCREALDRLNIRWKPGSAEYSYNKGETTQVPMQNVVRLNNRCRRTIRYANRELYYEGNVNAR